MPSDTKTRNLGAVSASSVVALSLDRDFKEFPPSARIATAVIMNSSRAALTVTSLPGGPQLVRGERVEIHPDARTLVLENDANAITDGQLKVMVRIEW